jgi:hypothetical protein
METILKSDPATNGQTLETSFSFMRGKLTAERKINTTRPYITDDNKPEFSLSVGPFKKNLQTGEVDYKPESNPMKLGSAAFFGVEIAYNPEEIDEYIEACRPR